MKKFYQVLFILLCTGHIYSQTIVPIARITWSVTPTGWTDSFSGTYTSALACDGNNNRAKFGNAGDFTKVFFSGIPNVLSFDLQGNTIGAASSCLLEQSADGTVWTTVDNISGISGNCVTYNYTLLCSSAYVRWTYTKVSGNLALDNVSITSTTITCGSAVCPSLTGAILNSCNNPGCNEGDAELMLFNSGSYSLTVSSLPNHMINYYGSTANFNAGTVDAYTGVASSNASVTSSLNNSTGCSGIFADANAAVTIPPGSTFIMVPNNFCYSDYDFSNLCGSFNKIYVVYFSTVGWNSSGNLANYQSGVNPKYLTVDFSWVSGSCGKEYYTFDAGQEYSGGTGGGDGASIAFPGSISTSSASPTSPNFYQSTAGGCTLPIVLPIELTRFTAKRTGRNIILNWSTASETNNNYFSAEYSLDGINFSAFEKIKGAGTGFEKEKYSCLFTKDIGSISPYFRLKQVDYNENYKYSPIITLTTTGNSSASVEKVRAYYNPDKDKISTVFTLDYPQEVSVSLYDLTGVKIAEVPFRLYNEGINEILITAPEKGGVYLSVYQTEGATPIRKKITIAK
jgi:hypothetical protein